VDLHRKLELMRQTAYFGSVPPEELRRLAVGLRERSYPAGGVIFRRGEDCPGLCIVLSGRVRTVTRSEEGREQVLKVFGPGHTFGEIPVFDNEPLPADAVAAADATIGVVPRTELLDLLRRHPDVSLDVIRLFAGRLRAYKQFIEDLSLRGVLARVARLLLDRSRGANTLTEEAADLSLPYTHDDIAAMVGSVREVVQRALKTLERARLIELSRGRIRITDADALTGWTDLGGTLPDTRERAKTTASRKGRAPSRASAV
jgi:CRP/FNR family transcriptional regulator, cyclic AMP receptor protein